jgi:O-antigen/teichoic acid export membrane protein
VVIFGCKIPKLFQDISSTLVVQVMGAVLVFGVQVLIARLLGADEFGQFVFIVTWMTFISLLGKMGQDGASSKFVREGQSLNNELLASAYAKYSLVHVLQISLTIVGLSLAVFYCAGRLSSDWIVALLGLPFIVVAGVQSGILRGGGYPVWSVVPQAIIRPVVTGLLLIAAWAIGLDVESTFAVVLFMIGFFVAVSISHRALKVTIGLRSTIELSSKRKRQMRSLGYALIGATGAILIMRQADILMLGVLAGTTEAGIYSAAVRITDIVAFPMIAANTLIGPLVAEFSITKRLLDLQQKISAVFRWLIVITLLVSVFILILGKQILGMFGQEFVAAYYVLGVLLVGQLINVAAGPAIEVLTNSGEHKVATKLLWVFVLVNILLNWILIPQFGMMGAASATAITVSAWNISLAAVAKRRSGVSTYAALLIRAR